MITYMYAFDLLQKIAVASHCVVWQDSLYKGTQLFQSPSIIGRSKKSQR